MKYKIKRQHNLYTIPIILLFSIIICTFYPMIYSYLPILGKIRFVLVAGVGMVLTYIFTNREYVNIGSYKNAIFYSLSFFVFSIILSLIVSLDRGKTLDLITVNVKYYLVILIMIRVIDSDKRLDLLLGVVSACGVGMAFNSVLNYAMGQTKVIAGYSRGLAIDIGIFGDPNDLAMFFNVTLSILLYFCLKKKFLAMLSAPVVLTAIVLTFSRGGFVGFCTLVLVFYVLVAKRQKKSFFFLGLAVLVTAMFAPTEYIERVSTILDWEVNPETGETGTRMDAWQLVAMEGLKNNPFLGIGAGSSVYVSGTLKNDWHLIHNTYIQVFSELGFLGLFFYLRLFYLPYKYYRSFSRLNENSNINLLCFRMILTSLFSYGVTIIFLPQAYSPMFYILMGILIVQIQLLIANN